MALRDALDRLREAAKTRIPAEARAVMERSTEELRASGIMQRIARVGQPAPDVTLLSRPLVTLLQRRAGGASRCPRTCRRSTPFGIDLPRGNGDGTWRLPVPARFVIDRKGSIRAVDADPDDMRRPQPAQTLEVLRRLPAK